MQVFFVLGVQVGQGLGEEFGEVGVFVGEVGGDEDLDVGVGDDEGQLALAEPRVERDRDSPGQVDGEEELEVGHAVRHQDADVAAGLESGREETAGQRGASVVQIPVGEVFAGE